VALLVVCLAQGATADGMGRVLTRHPDRCVRTAEFSKTTARPASPDRRQGRLQEDCVDGLKVEWQQNLQLGGRQLQVEVKYDHSAERQGVKEVKVCSGILDVLNLLSVSADASFDFEEQKTGVDVAMIDRSGTMLTLACDASDGVKEVSAFHRAGPINIQPRWLTKAKLLRFHVGRGGTFRRCPVSMQLDYPLAAEAKPEFEFKARRQLGVGRSLRAVWLATQRAVLVELQDSQTDKDATWIARARTPYQLGDETKLGATEFTLRRKWSW